jgi:hypothetical protein
MLERFFQSMPVAGATVGPLRPVGHDDVRVTVRLLTGRPVRMLDHLDQAVEMRFLAKIMTMDVLVIVAVAHRPMLPVGVRSGQAAAGQ